VIGTEYYGFMKISESDIESLREKGIEVHVTKTKEACRVFNELIRRGGRAVVALHLTC